MNDPEPNANMENKCPQCGAPLPSGVLAGLCPACLFKQGAATDTAMPPEALGFQPPTVEEVAKLFPQLEILSFIGKGGMGAVYKARQPALDRVVALKIIPPQTAAGPGFVERFNREARALAKLNHPNIVAVYEFGQANGLPFFIMEFVDGLNLRQLERAGKLSSREALQIVPQICEALQFAHDEGIVHRDIKPENILLDKKGRVKIADFGIAKILSTGPDVGITETGGAIGTPHYMAPEQMERPTTVDHRADIFSLGVVFYEMLTGELPLGKFGPPSSRKVEVDVRLDDVVLRALEKDPERRYQHASQVKTAVDTIAGSAPPPPPPLPSSPSPSSAPDPDAIAQDILARDYFLDASGCIRRGWNLVRGDFWPIVGVTALVMLLLGFASSAGGASVQSGPMGHNSGQISSVLAIILWGPMVGGLYVYFLNRIRNKKVSVETAFSGFSNRFLHLFLAGFVASLLTWLGYVCLVLPGIYLTIAWLFALPLVMDKGLDFWSAMELSRKVVTKHWWQFLWLGIRLALLLFAGALMFGVGLFVMTPIVVASLMFAYEDVFGSTQIATAPPVMGKGPFGTSILPTATPGSASGWSTARILAIGAIVVAAVFLFIVALGTSSFLFHRMRMKQDMQSVFSNPFVQSFAPPRPQIIYENPIQAPPTAQWNQEFPTNPPGPMPTFAIESPQATSPSDFGPVIELDLQARASGTNQFVNLDADQVLTPPDYITSVMSDPQRGDVDSRLWEALDIPRDSRRFKYPTWLRENGVDLMYAGNGKVIGFDGVFVPAHGDSSSNWDDWATLTPAQARAATAVVDWSRRAAAARARGASPPPAPASGGVFSSAAQLDSRESGGPLVNQLTRDQSVNWFFKTRDGAVGILQLVNFSDDPPAAHIRYKLAQPGGEPIATVPPQATGTSDGGFADRLQAALTITDFTARDRALGAVALNAARSGDPQVTIDALRRMTDFTAKDRTAHDAVQSLAGRGLRKQALQIAKTITDFTIRDQALSELAQ